MLTPTTTRKRPAGAMPRKAAARPPGQTCVPAQATALASLGDAVALIDRRSRQLTWASDAWRAMLPQLAEAREVAALEPQLTGLAAALDAGSDGAAPRRLELGDSAQWGAELVPLGDTDWLLRLTDRRELGRAMQRQLDDREQLLFTSRVFSVGEMATTLAHELNQPIGATANLLRGLRSRLARRANALSAEEAQALERALDVTPRARVVALSRLRREEEAAAQAAHRLADARLGAAITVRYVDVVHAAREQHVERARRLLRARVPERRGAEDDARAAVARAAEGEGGDHDSSARSEIRSVSRSPSRIGVLRRQPSC